MDDATFLRNLARRGRVVLLADGAAVPLPLSVVDDETRVGGTFRINLISPEADESGDRRTFEPGSTTHRELPIPLLWQWQLADGHKTAVVVGRIDYLEMTPYGYGNARGVFDNGFWGREAERMVRNRMLRGVSGDYTDFRADILEKVEDRDQRILDDKVNVTQAKLLAATIVAKPAFEGCYIEISDEDEFYPDGLIEGQIALTAAALLDTTGQHELLARLERLEQIEEDELSITASAAIEKVTAYRLQREREAAVARIRGARQITAAWKPLPSSFLSAKAKAQPRDSLGRWIEIGAKVRWKQGQEKIAGVQRGGKKSGYGMGAPYKQGTVKSFNAKTGEYEIEPLDGSTPVSLKGADVEVVKAVIPETPDEAKKITAELDTATQKLIGDTSAKMSVQDGARSTQFESLMGDKKPSELTIDVDEALGNKPAPTATPDEMIEAGDAQKKGLSEAVQAAKSDDPAIKEVGLDRLSQLMGAEIESGDTPFETNQQTSRREKQEAKDIARAAENDRFSPDEWPDRETLGRQLFNNLRTKNETWEKDSAKYLRAGDRLRRLSESRLISKKRRSWIKNTYGADAEAIADRRAVQDKNAAWSETWKEERAQALADQNPAPAAPTAPSPAVSEEKEIAPLAALVNNLWGDADTDEPAAPTAATDLWAEAKADKPKADAVSAIGGDIVKAQQAKNAQPTGPDDPLAVHDKALAEGNQWSDKPKKPVAQPGPNQPAADETPEDELEFNEKGSVQLKQGQSVSLTNPPKKAPSADEPEDVDQVSQAVDAVKNLVDSAGGVPGLDDYLDEIKTDPGTRTNMQFDNIESLIADNSDSFDDSEREAIENAIGELKKQALDTPGDMTIEDLDKPDQKLVSMDDLPDPGDTTMDDLETQPSSVDTVPEEWVAEKTADDAVNKLSDEIISKAIDKALEKILPGESPSGNVTEMAKNMFQNLYPEANWDDADQSVWLDAAKKAMENRND